MMHNVPEGDDGEMRRGCASLAGSGSVHDIALSTYDHVYEYRFVMRTKAKARALIPQPLLSLQSLRAEVFPVAS